MSLGNDRLMVKAPANEAEFLAYEKLLAEKLKDFLAELSLVNAASLVSHIVEEKDGNIDDIVSSSTELVMKPGTLRYGRNASVAFEWGEYPEVDLEMEFVNSGFTIFFNISFHVTFVGVDIRAILFRDPPGSVAENLRSFEAALDDARAA